MKNVAIIGAGQLGSRHLQALATVENINIYILDPEEKALQLSKARFNEVNQQNKNLNCLTEVTGLPTELEFVVIATNSKQRLSVLRQLLSHATVKYLLLEKFLFPKVEEYDEASELLSINGTSTYVNCSRGMWSSYKDLKKVLDRSQQLTFKVTGANWNMSSNAIHFLNIFLNLVGEETTSVDASFLDKEIIKNKRPGYIDFTGKIKAITPKGNTLVLDSNKDGDTAIVMEIASSKQNIEICESQGICKINQKEQPFLVQYQSQLTNLVYEELQREGKCDLVNYSQAKKEHLVLLEAINKFLNGREGAIT